MAVKHGVIRVKTLVASASMPQGRFLSGRRLKRMFPEIAGWFADRTSRVIGGVLEKKRLHILVFDTFLNEIRMYTFTLEPESQS